MAETKQKRDKPVRAAVERWAARRVSERLALMLAPGIPARVTLRRAQATASPAHAALQARLRSGLLRRGHPRHAVDHAIGPEPGADRSDTQTVRVVK